MEGCRDGREEKGKESGGSKEETTCQVIVCYVADADELFSHYELCRNFVYNYHVMH
jgi:hypothetical protein